MSSIRYLVFFVIAPSLAMHYQFCEKRELEIIAHANTARDLVPSVLTQLRLLCFAGERFCFDHTELFIFDNATASVDGYTIAPLPFDRYLPSFSDAHDLKKCWFAYAIAWLKRGIAIQKGEFADEVDLYVAYTTYRIARALEDLEGIALCDEADVRLDCVKQQLLKNMQALQRLFAVIQPLPAIGVTVTQSSIESASLDTWSAKMYEIFMRFYRLVNANTSIDEQRSPISVKLYPRMRQTAYRLWYDAYFRVNPIEWGESVNECLFKNLGIYQDVQVMPV